METTMNRRQFVELAAGAFAGSLGGRAAASAAAADVRIQAIAFDAFPIFDPRPIFTLADELFPGKGVELSNAWRTRQFEYTWLRTVGGRYASFWQVTEDALVFAARTLRLDLDRQRRMKLMNGYLNLKPWPEVPEALRALRSAGLRLAFLSNFTRPMLEAGIKNSRLDGMFEHVLSTDRVKQFKPSPLAYQMAERAFGLERKKILFAAFAGWDAAGAKWFGLPTAWVNRLRSPPEELSVTPDVTCQDLSDLVAYATARR